METIEIVHEVTREGAGFHRTHDDDSGSDILVPKFTDQFLADCRVTPTEHNLDQGICYPKTDSEPFIFITPHTGLLIPAGIKVDLPPGYDLLVGDKSGIAKKYMLHINGGLVDNPYTGEIHVHIMNLSSQPFILKEGMKIAQGTIRPIAYPKWVLGSVDKVTTRGAGGHGSTGEFVQPDDRSLLDSPALMS